LPGLVPDRHIFGRFWRSDWPRFRKLWALGVPIAATLAFEVGVFNAAAIVVGTFGPVPLAAHAIALQIAATNFMVPLGIAQAATVRVGLAYGAGDRDAMMRAGRVALVMATLFMAATAITLLAVPERLIAIFIDPAGQDSREVAALAVTFLFMAALFQLADGVQAVAAGLLRGVQDTRMPMIYAALGYWLVGAPLGLGLAFGAGFGAQGIWVGLCVGLTTVAALLLWRWRTRLAVTIATIPG
jgi:multidrug resistance protein, MATE family